MNFWNSCKTLIQWLDASRSTIGWSWLSPGRKQTLEISQSSKILVVVRESPELDEQIIGACQCCCSWRCKHFRYNISTNHSVITHLWICPLSHIDSLIPALVWLFKVRSHSPVSQSHILTMASSDTDTRTEYSGWKLTAFILSRWPVRVCWGVVEGIHSLLARLKLPEVSELALLNMSRSSSIAFRVPSSASKESNPRILDV